MVGIDDVARLAGVSTATVSRTLSGRGPVSAVARDRVEAAARELGYVVSAAASSLASGRARSVGVLTPLIDMWYFSTVLGGISSVLAARGYDLTLYSLDVEPESRRRVLEEHLGRQRVDALISVALGLASDIERVAGLGIPVLAIGGPNPGLPTLDVDEPAVARVAMGHLLDLGHRDIAHIGATPVPDLATPVATLRREGFDRALADAGIRPRPGRTLVGDFTIDGGFRAARTLLDDSDAAPTAIFAASDEMAIGAMLAARSLGLRVPEDVSVIGIDGHELGATLGLTTVDQHVRGQGERAATEILTRLEDPDAATPAEPLPFSLVVRASTGPPRTPA